MLRDFLNKDFAISTALFIASLATGFYFATAGSDFFASRRPVRFAELEALRVSDTFKQQQLKLESANARTSALIEQLIDLTKTALPNSSLVARQLTLLKHDSDNLNIQVADLRSSVEILNKSIESSPEKALTLPLLKKDLEDFKTASQRDVDSLRAEMLRGYELNKWLIGLMLAAIVGVVIKSALESKPGRTTRPTFE